MSIMDRRGLLKATGVLGAGGLMAVARSGTASAAMPTQTKTGNYTLASTDAGSVIQFDSTSDVTLTVPASVGWVGMLVEICQINVGKVHVAGGAVDSPGSLTTRTQYSTAGLRKRSSSRWVLTGDTA